jgi:NarL family two-component system response regulator LiaR
LERIKVMLVDDHEMVRMGMKAYLQTEEQIELIGEASSGLEAAKLAPKLKPDVILMDLLMENGNGIEATKAILSKMPTCKIIILTSYFDDEQVFPAIEAGAFSYMLKTASAEEVALAIYKAVKNQTVIESKVANKMMNRLRPKEKEPHHDLTERELEVLRYIAEGKSNQEIGEALFIGIKTVKTHVSNILSKLYVIDRTQAAIYANRHGIILEQKKDPFHS